jgi:aryl-alcohol dehydrogenase-like predicted oxidoreductase
MFDTAENYEKGQSEREMYAIISYACAPLLIVSRLTHSGRVIHELGLRRSDIIVTTKIFWGTRPGPNNGGLSRKQ